MPTIRARLVVAGLLAALLAVPAGAAPSGQDITDAPLIRAAVTAAIDPDTKRDAPRLPRVGIDSTGDVTVVFALRDEGELGAIRAGAQADALAILSAVYHSPDAHRVTTTTVVGTFSVIGKRDQGRELPVLRAVLTAERAAGLDWDGLAPEQLPEIVDVWWLHAAFGNIGALRGEEP